jgi:hypothetical protein
VERKQHLSASRWLRYGDICSKAFFDFHRIGKKRTFVRELETEEGIVSGQSDLALYVTSFYANLYSSDALAQGTAEAQTVYWKSVPAKVTQAMNERLTRDLSLKDVTDAIKAFPKGNGPGHDRVPMEFFQEFEKEVMPMLLHAFSAMFRVGATSTHINKGLITLIPKSRDQARLNNWRPITLLGNLYKVLAKVLTKTLARRIQTDLTEIIRPNQTGFVEGRSILDNVFMVQETLGWAEESNQDLVLLLLDFEKTFDKIEWDFLFKALDKLGFSPTWVRWVASLYQYATSAIKVNGVADPNFQLAKSVRQGCPLAPYLFILATNVLGYMLANPKHGVEGLSLPKGGLIRDQTFANDTALYLKGTPANMDRAQEVLKTFCRTFRAKVNWRKSAAIWASQREKSWEWGENEGLKWISKGKGTRYLRIQVGFHLPSEANFDTMMLALKGKLINWNSNKFSLAGKILVANQVLLASIWYLAACWNPDPKMCSQVTGLIRNFIWGARRRLRVPR